MDIPTWIGIGFSSCCCAAFFLAILAILIMVLRPKRRQGETPEGVAPAPLRGVETRASLTRLEANRPELRNDIELTVQTPAFYARRKPPEKPK